MDKTSYALTVACYGQVDYTRQCIWMMPAGPDGRPVPADRKVFAALALGLPGCVCGAGAAWLAGKGRPWDAFRITATTLAALNLATIAAWGLLHLMKSGAIRF